MMKKKKEKIMNGKKINRKHKPLTIFLSILGIIAMFYTNIPVYAGITNIKHGSDTVNLLNNSITYNSNLYDNTTYLGHMIIIISRESRHEK